MLFCAACIVFSDSMARFGRAAFRLHHRLYEGAIAIFYEWNGVLRCSLGRPFYRKILAS